MILEQIGVIALVSYIRRIDPDVTRPFEELCREVRAQAWRYYNLANLGKWQSRSSSARCGRGP